MIEEKRLGLRSSQGLTEQAKKQEQQLEQERGRLEKKRAAVEVAVENGKEELFDIK